MDRAAARPATDRPASHPQVGRMQPEPGQISQRQVDPAAVEVLGHVPDEVGELEGEPELAGGFPGGGRLGRTEDRQHHRADHRRRALHVLQQVAVGRVRRHGQVHRHRAQERGEVGPVELEHLQRVQHRRQDRIVDPYPGEAGQEPVAPGAQPGRPVAGRRAVHRVHDLVGVPREPVQRMHVPPFPGRQEPGGQVVRATVPPVQPPAQLVRLTQAHQPPTDATIDATRSVRYAGRHGQPHRPHRLAP